MTDTEDTIDNSCRIRMKMRQQYLQFTKPPNRLEIISPYTNTTVTQVPGPVLYTKKQLDMRRKYEILKYKQNTSSKNSKKNKYSQLMQYPTRNTTHGINGNGNNVIYSVSECPLDELQPVSTTSSGVPGKTEMLYYEPNVPLYNYDNERRDYAIINKTLDKSKIAEAEAYTNIQAIVYNTLTNNSHSKIISFATIPTIENTLRNIAFTTQLKTIIEATNQYYNFYQLKIDAILDADYITEPIQFNINGNSPGNYVYNLLSFETLTNPTSIIDDITLIFDLDTELYGGIVYDIKLQLYFNYIDPNMTIYDTAAQFNINEYIFNFNIK